MRDWRTPAAIAFLLLLAGCGRGGNQPGASATPAGAAKVAYVRIEELVKDHPLYGQLAQTERSIDALNLTALGPDITRTGGDLSREDAQLNRQLRDAQERTKKALDTKQDEYRKQEAAAIQAAIGAGSAASNGKPIGGGLPAIAGKQASGVAARLDADLRSYQHTLEAQDRAQAQSLAQALSQRADRQYRTKADELQAKESAYALELASKDSGDRLQLRTQLANLALDDASREEVRKKIADLDRKEADAVAAMRNRDQQSLAQIREQLKTGTQGEIATGVAKIHAGTQSKMRARAEAARAQIAGQMRALPAPSIAGNANVPADMRVKIQALHKDYQDRFNRDARATLDDFNRTRDDLRKRYDTLHGVNTAAQESARKEIASLRAQHDKLYNQIVDQINREVRTLAQGKGIAVVVNTVAGPGEGIDLTSAAKKEIESLHE